MIYIIYTFVAFIIFAIVAIMLLAKEFFNLKWQTPIMAFTSPPIIERAYRSVDFVTSVRYIKEEAFMHYRFMPDPDVKVLHNQKHREHIIRDCVYSLTNEMLKAGVVEVKDNQDDPHYHGNPYEGEIKMRIKAYKPYNL